MKVVKQQLNKAIQKQKGFTLIELLVVVAIIAILAAVGIPAYSGYQVNARAQAAEDQFSAVQSFLSAESKRCSTSKSIQLLDGTDGGTFTGGLTGINGGDYLCRSALTPQMIIDHYNDAGVEMQNVYLDGPAVGAGAAFPATLGTISVAIVANANIQNGRDIQIRACLDARGAEDGTQNGVCSGSLGDASNADEDALAVITLE